MIPALWLLNIFSSVKSTLLIFLLYQNLLKGKVSGAALDVLECENETISSEAADTVNEAVIARIMVMHNSMAINFVFLI